MIFGGRISDYVYDDLYRLTSETITDAVNGNHQASYTYDAVGNRLTSQINGISTVYTYDSNDRLSQAGGITYDYDANGNMIKETEDGISKDYIYNKKNELIEFTSNTDTYQHQYDPHGVRTESVLNGVMTEFLIDHNQTYAQVLLETSPSNQISYTYGDDLLTQESSSGLFYFHYDGLGSTRLLTDASAVVTDTYQYDAFGNLLAQTGTTENNYLFTGEQFDPNLGFYYLRARYMNPQVGRFVSMDRYPGSMGEPITLNKYLYANSDPVNFTDPSGFFGISEFGAAQRIRGILAEQTVNIGLNILDTALNPENAERNAKASLLLGVASIGGSGAFKLMRILSGKFRKACNSFADNTMISTEFGFKDIDDIQIGERVWAFNEKTGEVALQEVIHTIIGQELKSTIDITLTSGEVIQATAGHPLYAQSQGLWNWVDAEDLSIDMLLIDRSGEEVFIQNIIENQTQVQVYNLTVAGGHTYYVTTDEVLVHNMGVCKPLNITNNSVEHIFKGNKTGGFHSRPGSINPGRTRVVGEPTLAVSSGSWKGAYEATVRICPPGKKCFKKKNNSFFPDSWSRSRVQSEIQAAYIDAITKGQTGRLLGRSTSGGMIEMFVKPSGELITAYPKLRRP